MMLSKDQSQLEGRWFWGAYRIWDDVEMRRALGRASVLGVDKFALKTGSSASDVQIYGDRLRRKSVASISMCRRLCQECRRHQLYDMWTVAPIDASKRDVAIKAAVALAQWRYDHIDYLKVSRRLRFISRGASRFRANLSTPKTTWRV